MMVLVQHQSLHVVVIRTWAFRAYLETGGAAQYASWKDMVKLRTSLSLVRGC